MRVLYFTVTPLMDAGNGGSICCRNHIARLLSDPGIEKLVCMVAGPVEWKAGTDAYFASIGIEGWFQPIFPWRTHPEKPGLRSTAMFAASTVFQFDWELKPLNQQHIQEGIDWAIRGYAIDTLIIDYHPSALFIALPRTDVRTVLIGLNREGDFYADRVRLGQTHHGSVTGPISIWRARRWERRVNASVDKVVTIGPHDLPRDATRSPPVCITPYLDAHPNQWFYTDCKSAFFVGNIAHYPNRLAIEWITQRLAPALLACGSRVRLQIVGATPDQLPAADHVSNVDFLGLADADFVSALYQSENVMLCPILNDYGVKFKALEALSYGTPLLASRQTLLGLPRLVDMPVIELEEPEAAAATLAGLVEDPARLQALHESQARQLALYASSQTDIWSSTIASIPERNSKT